MVKGPCTAKDAPPERSDESLSNIWGSYQSSASIHGVAQAGGPPLYSFRKWIWLFLVIAMTIGLSVILFRQVQILAGYPMRTSVGAQFEAAVPFPAVTLCNLNQFMRSVIPNDTGLQYFIRLQSEFESLKDRSGNLTYPTPKRRTHHEPAKQNITASKNTSASYEPPYSNTSFSKTFAWSKITGPELSEITWKSAQTMDSFLYLCSWDGQVMPCGDLFETRMTDLGVCFTFNGGGNVSLGGKERLMSSFFGSMTGLRVLMFLKQDEYYFSKTMQSGAKVVLHEPEEEPLPSNSGMSLRPGVSADLAFTRQELVGLPAPYKAYANAYCVDTESEEAKEPILRRYKFYTEMACYRDCLLEFILSWCNCTNPFEPEDGISVCSVDEMIDCYLPAREMLTKKHLEDCDCRPPCRRVVYDIRASYADFASDFSEELTRIDRNRQDDKSPYLRRNVIDIRVFLESKLVVRITQEPAMTFSDILGTLGGHLGLFLGASILSITELTEVVLLLVLRRLGFLGAVNARTAESEGNGSANHDVTTDPASAAELSSAPSSPSASLTNPAADEDVGVVSDKRC